MESSVPTPPWRKSRKLAPKKPPLSQDLIVETALRILDEEGLDAVSMRRVAQELDTGPASLYAHVANKEELLDILYDLVVGEIEMREPDPARWREQLRELCIASQRVLAAHNDIAKVSLAVVPTGPNSLLLAENMLGIMIGGGVSPQIAAWGLDRLGLYISADVYEGSLLTMRQRASGKEFEEWADEYFAQVEDYMRNLPADRFPYVSGHVDALVAGDGDQRFLFGLDLLIAGIAETVGK